MSVVVKISKTYRRPIRTYSNLFASGPSEKQNLAYLMGACLLYFISSWPFQARKAFEDQIPLEGLISGTLISALFVAPLGFYLISIVFHLLAKALGSKISGVEIRLILFWAFLAIAPLMLLRGLVAGFFDTKLQYSIVSGLALSVLVLFIYSGFKGLSR